MISDGIDDETLFQQQTPKMIHYLDRLDRQSQRLDFLLTFQARDQSEIWKTKMGIILWRDRIEPLTRFGHGKNSVHDNIILLEGTLFEPRNPRLIPQMESIFPPLAPTSWATEDTPFFTKEPTKIHGFCYLCYQRHGIQLEIHMKNSLPSHPHMHKRSSRLPQHNKNSFCFNTGDACLEQFNLLTHYLKWIRTTQDSWFKISEQYNTTDPYTLVRHYVVFPLSELERHWLLWKISFNARLQNNKKFIDVEDTPSSNLVEVTTSETLHIPTSTSISTSSPTVEAH